MGNDEKAVEVEELNKCFNVTMILKEDFKNLYRPRKGKWIEGQTRRFSLLEKKASGNARKRS